MTGRAGGVGLRKFCKRGVTRWGGASNPAEFPTRPGLLPTAGSARELRIRNLVNKPLDISMNLPMDYHVTYAPMLGHSPQMRAVRQSIEQVADTDATVLIL